MKSFRQFYKSIKSKSTVFEIDKIGDLLNQISQNRVNELSIILSKYIYEQVPKTIEKKKGLNDYRTNPYVLMASASLMNLDDPNIFSNFLFNNKLYMGLETSFGKSIEALLFDHYPLNADTRTNWDTPPEKVEEFLDLKGLDLETKARVRTGSVWREIDKSCVVGNRRFLLTIKSGPSTINDTQVSAMEAAIANNRLQWWQQSRQRYKDLEGLDIIIGLTYGTNKTTNNKENQILVKLLDRGFQQEDSQNDPGILIDPSGRIRVYRRIGIDFWSTVGNPIAPDSCQYVFLEILLSLAKALSKSSETKSVEDSVNRKIQNLAQALSQISFPRNALPQWIKDTFDPNEIVWLAAAMTAFFDEGI